MHLHFCFITSSVVTCAVVRQARIHSGLVLEGISLLVDQWKKNVVLLSKEMHSFPVSWHCVGLMINIDNMVVED